MSPLDAFWHIANFFVPALGVGVLTTAAMKLLWRPALSAVPWPRLAASAVGAGALVSLAGLVLSGRDGLMLTYTALVAAEALALWWVGFGPGRR